MTFGSALSSNRKARELRHAWTTSSFPWSGDMPSARARDLHGLAVLDCGYGNGLSVDILRGQGMDAWGIDAGRSRHRQWQQRQARALPRDLKREWEETEPEGCEIEPEYPYEDEVGENMRMQPSETVDPGDEDIPF
jgi:hypothetical protein